MAYRPVIADGGVGGRCGLPLMFAGSLYVVPDGLGVTSLPMALALTALVACCYC